MNTRKLRIQCRLLANANSNREASCHKKKTVSRSTLCKRRTMSKSTQKCPHQRDKMSKSCELETSTANLSLLLLLEQRLWLRTIAKLKNKESSHNCKLHIQTCSVAHVISFEWMSIAGWVDQAGHVGDFSVGSVEQMCPYRRRWLAREPKSTNSVLVTANYVLHFSAICSEI